MKNKKLKVMFICFLAIVIVPAVVIGLLNAAVDPYFHYRAPKTDEYFYKIDNERSQNNGILKCFDYDAIITGTSMTQNFKTSQLDKLFGTNSIKVPLSGGTYSEINEQVCLALINSPNLKMVVRGLDMNMLMLDKDSTAADPETYPQYLYDAAPLNDIKYLLNREAFFNYTLPMLLGRGAKDFKPGITSFDEYQNWGDKFDSGFDVVCPNGIENPDTSKESYLSDAARAKVTANVQQNVTSLAAGNPGVTFYYFFTPYSAVWWRDLVDDGSIYKQIETEQVAIEEMLKHDNIKLFSFNTFTDLTTNLDNYIEPKHYTANVNDQILDWMKEGTGLLTMENYKAYLSSELDFYITLNYKTVH